MAGTLKRRRGPVSYKEPSSDEGFSDLTDDSDRWGSPRKRRAGPQRRSARNQPLDPDQAGSRRHPPYKSVSGCVSTRELPNVQLRGKRRISYNEDSTDDDSLGESDSEESVPTPAPKHPRSGAPTSPGQKKKRPGRPRARGLGAPVKPRKDPPPTSAVSNSIPSDDKIPPWSTLPYHILLQIFVYASHPLHDDNFAPTPSIPWLARTARICTAFVKPALTALYRNPPIFAVRHGRKTFVQHLTSPPSNPFVDYSVMVKRLELDATRMSKLTDPKSSISDLAALISSLKTLKEVDIFDPYDKPPYRERSRRTRRWYYPEELFVALNRSGLRLRSWRWNGTFCADGPLWMKEVHTSTPFQSLRELSLTRFQAAVITESAEGEPTTEELLGSALAVLPNLKTLALETCTGLSNGFLSLLPKNLVSINVTNCRELTADALQAFLVTHGSHLEELTLNHNQSLDLSFLATLKQTTPRLEVLRMDMHYYNTLQLSSDNEPLYDVLLDESEIPSWPCTLKAIDLEFLRNWSSTAAVMFFTSLIDSAEELPWLQEIKITAIVDIDWRKRAEFRKEWTRRFQQVFARKWSPPNPALVSLKAFRDWKESPNYQHIAEDVEIADTDDVATTEENESRGTRRWNSHRLRSRRTRSGAYDENTDSEASSSDDVDDGSDSKAVKYVQGRCHTVVFRVDNSRPQEQIYDEEDFLDDEVSGDEDWDGNEVEDDGYAW